MLPDFPEGKKRFRELFDERWRQRVMGTGVPSLSKPTIFFEGNRWRVEREDRSSSDDGFERLSSTMEFLADELDTIASEGIMERWDKVSSEMQEGMTRQLLKALDEACEATGNTLRAPNIIA